tara:strand:- start:373 stop:852 length:480 start_codon:yes stop_codon:yes gene_type:complete
MKITKKQLRRIIATEGARIRRRMRECGEDMAADDAVTLELGAAPLDAEPTTVLEGQGPEENVLVEMELASRALDQVLESVQNAAHLCPDCVPAVATQAPLLEAMASQAEALQEMVAAQTDMLQENSAAVDIEFTGDVADIPAEEAFGLGYEAGIQGLGE